MTFISLIGCPFCRLGFLVFGEDSHFGNTLSSSESRLVSSGNRLYWLAWLVSRVIVKKVGCVVFGVAVGTDPNYTVMVQLGIVGRVDILAV